MSNKSDKDNSVSFSLNDIEDKFSSDFENDDENESIKLAKKIEKLSFTKPSPTRQRYTPTRKKKHYSSNTTSFTLWFNRLYIYFKSTKLYKCE